MRDEKKTTDQLITVSKSPKIKKDNLYKNCTNKMDLKR